MLGDFLLGQFAYHPLGMWETTVPSPPRGGGPLQRINGIFFRNAVSVKITFCLKEEIETKPCGITFSEMP